jgi:hypothetical protein
MIIDALSPDGPGCKKLESSKAIPFAGLYHRPPSSCRRLCIDYGRLMLLFLMFSSQSLGVAIRKIRFSS